jgi:phosphoglycolate phosphatase
MITKDHTLVLFDIDGTLTIYNDDFPHRMFEELAEHFFAKKISLEDYRFSGKTDKNIIAEVIERAGVPEDQFLEKEAAIVDWVPARLERHISHQTFSMLPKVNHLVEELSKRDDTTLALLTGNLPRCAELKLAQFALFHYFEFGAYGIESRDRNDLGPIAIEKFNSLKGFHPSNIVIIGDAIADVLVAKHIGAKAVMTLTGRTTREELLPYDPEYIFDDLSEIDSIIAAIYN